MPEVLEYRFPSPLRYPGGKGKVANFIKLLFIQNGFTSYHYVEPYAGGASVALSLLYEEYASHIHINDLNSSVYAFWYVVLNETEALCRRIMDTAVTIDEWERQRNIQRANEPDLVDLAFSTFFLNRTNRSGIISGGVIGGKDQTGGWKLDARYNKTNLVSRIKKVARYKNRITLTQLDAADYISKTLVELPEEAFIYLDPPYYVKGKGLYEHFYQHDNHTEIAELVQKIKQPWLVSYDSVPEILALYSDFKKVMYGLSYSAANRYQGAEVMFFSPAVKQFDVESPANVKADFVNEVRKSALLFM